MSAFRGKADMAYCSAHVCLWPIADIASCAAHVRFRGQSGHDLVRMSAFVVAIGGKADIVCCGAYVRF
jgi:hypothetical protein